MSEGVKGEAWRVKGQEYSGFQHRIAHNREFSRNGDRIAPMQQNLHDDNPHRPALFLIDWQ